MKALRNPRDFDESRFHDLTILVNRILREDNFQVLFDAEAEMASDDVPLDEKEKLYVAYAVLIKHLGRHHVRPNLEDPTNIPAAFYEAFLQAAQDSQTPPLIKAAIEYIQVNFNHGTTAVKREKARYGEALIAVTLRGASNTINRQLALCPHLNPQQQQEELIAGAKTHSVDGAAQLPQTELDHINGIRKPVSILEEQVAVGCPAALAGVLGNLIAKAIQYTDKNPPQDTFSKWYGRIFWEQLSQLKTLKKLF